MSSTAKFYEEDVAEQSAASIYIDNLGDADGITLVTPSHFTPQLSYYDSDAE
jgi:hypothetical protein